jgi:hypothetical protein
MSQTSPAKLQISVMTAAHSYDLLLTQFDTSPSSLCYGTGYGRKATLKLTPLHF